MPETGLALVPKKSLSKIKKDSATNGTISSVMKLMAGGKKTFMELAHFAPDIDPALNCIIEDYDGLSATGKKVASLDQMCRARGIDPYHFLGVVTEAAVKFRDNASVMVAAMSMPQIVQRSVKEAMKKDGIGDRKLLFQHSGFTPVPASAQFVNNFAAKVEQNNTDTAPGRLPSFEASAKVLDIEAE